MRIEHLQWGATGPLEQSLRNGVVSIGKFDGVHKGHAAILRRVRELGFQHARPALAISFDRHPTSILHPDRIPPTLSTFRRKVELIGEYRLDALVLIETNLELLDLSPEEFVQSYLLEKIGASYVVEGESFTFGKNRLGNARSLQTLCRQAALEVEIVPPVWEGEQVVSSSRLRKLVREGEIEAANSMLTRPYRLSGKVVHGEHRGTGLGFPTANLSGIRTMIPKDGVYACLATCGGKRYSAPTSVGENPTFGEDTRKIEAYLLGCDEDLYEKTIHLDFTARLRDIRRFDSSGQLIEQIRADIEATRSLHGNLEID